jgi:hypothetical protein
MAALNPAGIGAEAITGGISSLISIIPSILQAIQGRKQSKLAQRIEDENQFPETSIAPSVDKYVNYSLGQTLNQDIPGGEMYRNEIKGATASGIRAASELGSGSEAYGMMGELIGRQQGQLGNLAKMTAQQVSGYKDDYRNSLLAKGQEENRVWEWNKAQPYLQAASMASQLRNAGPLNAQAGLSNAFGSLAEYGGSLSRDIANKNAATFTAEDIKKLLESFNSGSFTTSGNKKIGQSNTSFGADGTQRTNYE